MNGNESSSNEMSYSTTPVRNDSLMRRKGFNRNSLNPYRVHVDMNSTAINASSSAITIDKMPIYSPPSAKANFPIKNPFEQSWLLKEKLSQPVCSPSLFQKVLSPIKNSAFSWNIEDISTFRPAPIDENPSQDFASFFSPNTESQAQEAIDRFFSSQNTLESPVEVKEYVQSEKTRTIGCQTKLSFPVDLPDAILAQLEHISLSFSSCSLNDSMNTSNCSARRKLLSGDEALFSSDDEQIVEKSPSIKDESMQVLTATPVQRILSSPEMSPILKVDSGVEPMNINDSWSAT